MPPPTAILGFNTQLGSFFGWGCYSINVVLQLLSGQQVHPLLLKRPALLEDDPVLKYGLCRSIAETDLFLEALPPTVPGSVVQLQVPVLHSLGQHFLESDFVPDRFWGMANVGKVVFEIPHVGPMLSQNAAQFDLILTVSRWTTDYLQSVGIKAVCNPEGVDPARYFPAPKLGVFGERFVIFSGGKFELRKGQDIVAAAFEIFVKKHPDAFLIATWHNLWRDEVDLAAWIRSHGISEEYFWVPPPNSSCAPLMRESDVALFPNRCEGGHNFVALECMASGIPTILSANTGHLEIIHPEHPTDLILKSQAAVPCIDGLPTTQGWGESHVDEVVAALEAVYTQRQIYKDMAVSYSPLISQRHSWAQNALGLQEALATYGIL